MKLVLASQGFTTDEIAKRVSELAGIPLNEINVVIINQAHVASAVHDKRWLINELSLIAKYCGGTINFLDICDAKTDFEKCDLIYIVGGAQFILPELFISSGFDKTLRELAKTKIIMGTSAGTTVLGKHFPE